MAMEKSVCYGCDSVIEDRYLLRVMDQCWHERCLYCSVCMQPLRHSCFIKDRQLYCKLDYDRLYGVRCARCLQLIPSHEFVMRAVNQVYHVTCFLCVVCGRQLNKGDQFLITDSAHIYCSVHFDVQSQSSSYVQLSPDSQFNGDWFTGRDYKSDDDSSLDDDGDQPKGPKRPRTILTTSQRRKFKASFEVNSKPCRKVRETLAAETGLSVRVVQVWFQNQRAKMKKLARRQTEDCQQTNGSNKDKKNTMKSNKKLRDDDILQSPLAPSIDNSSNQTSGQCLDNSHHQSNKSIDMAAYNSTSDSRDVYGDLFPDDNHADQHGIDMTTHTIESLTMLIAGGCATDRSTVAPSGVGNPIDKLYSMHTSYFSGS